MTRNRTDLCFAKGPMSLQNPRLRSKPMPQLDFRQAFVSADHKPSPADSAQINQATRAANEAEHRVATRWGRSNPLNRSNWANITFVAVTFVGGLFLRVLFLTGRTFCAPRPRGHGNFSIPDHSESSARERSTSCMAPTIHRRPSDQTRRHRPKPIHFEELDFPA